MTFGLGIELNDSCTYFVLLEQQHTFCFAYSSKVIGSSCIKIIS